MPLHKLSVLAMALLLGCGGVARVYAQETAAVAAAPGAEEMSSGRARRLLDAEKFAELDQYADKVRREKTREIGGGWKLADFYGSLDSTRLSDQDTLDHLAHVEHWMAARPDSITARIVMAHSLVRWAWVARGNGYADTITPQGAVLFQDRAERALQVLKGAQDRKPMDPEWFSEMLQVGTALNWSGSQMKDIYERGAQMEPAYSHLCARYANYLLPKWDGQPGEAAHFAKKAADRVGGGEGDLLYFQLASVLIRRGSGNASPKDVDWNRLQHGYQVMQATYGVRPHDVNELAFLAYIFHDRNVATQQFALIGNAPVPKVWGNRNYYNRARDWAAGRAGDSEGAVSRNEEGKWE